ncbi:hypothetical protein ABE494_06840 [Stenotrophomonas lactitubi]|uniref:hypothetical protein n=1 Tax=Stenotrophomonas TaxID=40323 RepID=UPI0011B1FE22|nr:hypothetical protein [Stenotrophomonas sp. HMWF023]
MLLMFVGVVQAEGALAAEDSAENWSAVIGKAALVEFSAGTVPGVTETSGSLRQYRHGEWLLFTRRESSAEVGPAAILLCNGLLLANPDHFRTHTDGTSRPLPAPEAAWRVVFNAYGLAGGRLSDGQFLSESGQTHLETLVDDALWGDGPVRARVSRTSGGDITIRLGGDDARDSDGVKRGFWSEAHIRGDRSLDALPPSMSVHGWSAVGGGQFYTVGQARRVGGGCPGAPDSPVWPFQ